MDAELRGQLAAGGDAITGAKVAGVHQRAQLVADLDVERDVAFGLELQRHHWL
jgi:hypothetical protein